MKNRITLCAVLNLCLAAIFFSLAFTDCSPPGVVPNPPHVTDTASCPSACANLQRLGCDEGKPVSMGAHCLNKPDCLDMNGKPDQKQECVQSTCQVSCTTFCLDTENSGVWLDPTCVSTITACNQVNSCPSHMPQ